MSDCYLYVMGNLPSKMIYLGITYDLKKRVKDHKDNLIAGFSNEYKVNSLIYYERFSDFNEAVAKEQMFKKWKNREWLLSMIGRANPLWRDLYEDLLVLS